MNSQMQLYYFSGSPFAWRIQLAFALKGIEYDAKLLQSSKQEHKQPPFLQLNPRGKIPVLVDGEHVLRESLAILLYLDQKFSWHWFGDSPFLAGQIWQQLMEMESILVTSMVQFVRPIFFGGLPEKSDEVIAASEAIAHELSLLDTQLKGRTWLVGDEITAADVATYPLVKFIERAAGNPAIADMDISILPICDRYPFLHNWVNTLEALPRVKDTYPPSWK
ncbi:MAG: glutathione S-transferase family protein [Cyanobacteria bacterium P01_F01_bin.42]